MQKCSKNKANGIKVISDNKLKLFFRIFYITLKSSPVLLICHMSVNATQGFLWSTQTVLQQRFFDSITIETNGHYRIDFIIVSLVLWGSVIIVTQLINSFTGFLNTCFSDNVRGKLIYDIQIKASKIPPEYYEDIEKLNIIKQATDGIEGTIKFFFSVLSIISFYFPYFFSISGYFASINPIFIIIVFAAFFPSVFSYIFKVNENKNTEDKSVKERRKVSYYESCIKDREYFKETRLLGAYNFFHVLYVESLSKLLNIQRKMMFKTGLVDIIVRVLTVIGYCTAMCLLFASVTKGELTVGVFAAIFSSLDTLYRFAKNLLIDNLGSVGINSSYISSYFKFLDMQECGGENKLVNSKGKIVLHKVSYIYPSSNRYAVKNINLTIYPGETIAFVGENGSGKSTLMRLITGIYTPSEGDVIYDGINIRGVKIENIVSNLSAVFQKYQKYKLNLRDNIIISSSENYVSDMKLEKMYRNSHLITFDQTFEKKFDTVLSEEFGGVELSGGQWQRIAIMRGLFRKHNIIVLDEPTAAIDPLAEAKLYRDFYEISRGKTTLLITHRLAAAKYADRIVVMNEGKIEEIGTHNDLLERKGLYAKLYKLQQSWYN